MNEKIFISFHLMLSRTQFCRWNRIIVTSSTNPYLNLAQELALFDTPLRDERILYLWRNSPVVVIGKHQNPYKECNIHFMNQNGVYLARRPTGGGAVYQDLGNTCWTFIDTRFEPRENTRLLCNALRRFGIKAVGTGRNDVEVDGKKVSGAAFRRTPTKSIHHGTMLLNVNMSMLVSCLTVSGTKLAAKGVDSVRSRVVNLSEMCPQLNHDKFCDALIAEFQKMQGECPIKYIGEQVMLADPRVKAEYETLKSKEWLYRGCAKADIATSKRFDFGLFDVVLQMERGEVKNCQVNSDCLIPEVVEKFEECINKVGRATVKRIDYKADFVNSMGTKEEKEMAEELLKWILPEMKQWTLSRR